MQLQAFPKAVLDVYCTVLEAGGSELAAAVTAAAMAVADAGIEMVDLSPACSVVRAARRRMPRLRVCACVPQGCGTSDASPPLPPLPCAGVVQSRVDGALLLDPTADESFREEASLLVALSATNNEVRSGLRAAHHPATLHRRRPATLHRRRPAALRLLMLAVPAGAAACTGDAAGGPRHVERQPVEGWA